MDTPIKPEDQGTGNNAANADPKAPATPLKFPKATGLLVIVLFAVGGYLYVLDLVKQNLVQYRTPPKTFLIGVTDSASKTGRSVFCLPVSSRLRIDSVVPAKKPDAEMVYHSEDILFHENPVFMVWMILICSMASIASGAVVFFIVKIIELYQRFAPPKTVAARFSDKFGVRFVFKLILSCFFASFIIALLHWGNGHVPGYFQPPEIIDTFHILLKSGDVIVNIVTAMLLLSFPGLVLLFLIGSFSDNVNIKAKLGIDDPHASNQTSIEEAAINLKYLNHLLQNTLQILAVIVVFAVLTTKTLGDAIKATIHVKGFDLYPSQVSYVYGMYFTLFLCIIYIPVYSYLKNNYNYITDLAAREPGGTTSPWYTSLFGQNKFEGTALSNMKLALTVVAPLLTSLLPDVSGLLK